MMQIKAGWRCALAAMVALSLSSVGSQANAEVTTVSNGGLLTVSIPARIDVPGGTSTRFPVSNGQFSPDGASLAFVDGSPPKLRVQHPDGTVTLLGGAPGTGLRLAGGPVAWSDDGSYVVASVIDDVEGDPSLWRYQQGHAPALVRSWSGYVYVAVLGIRPGTDLLTYAMDGDLYTVDALTGENVRWTHNCDAGECTSGYYMLAGDWPASGDRLLVDYITADDVHHLGWLSPGSEVPEKIRDVNSQWQDSVGPIVAPDGSSVAWTYVPRYEPNGLPYETHVQSIAGGAVLTMPAPYYSDWQPCPNGVCPTFVVPKTLPGAPKIGTASPGPVGGRLTARVSWRLGNNLAPDLTGFVVQAQKVNASGAVVRRISAARAATVRAAVLALPKGRFKFRVRARNADGLGPWSANSNVVRSR